VPLDRFPAIGHAIGEEQCQDLEAICAKLSHTCTMTLAQRTAARKYPVISYDS
jgi:hypothetical protein